MFEGNLLPPVQDEEAARTGRIDGVANQWE